MRILFLTPGWPPEQNGVGDYTHSLTAELVRKGVEVSVLTRSNLSRIAHRLNEATSVFGAGPRWDLPTVYLLLPLIKSIDPDIIHTQYEGFGFNQSFFLPNFLRSIKAAKVTTMHEVWFKSWLHRARDKNICKLSSQVIVNDEGCLRRYRQLAVKVEASKIGVGSNIPVVPTSFQEIDEGPIWIGYFGFFNLIKRVNYLLEALKIIRTKTRRDFRMLLVGEFTPESSPYHNELLELKNRLGLDGIAQFTGAVSGLEASTRLAKCHMAVLPFIDGATPRRGSFQACTSLGLPIISTKGPDIEPEICHGTNALLMNSLTVNEIATSILQLVEDRPLRLKLREGSLNFHRKYSWESIADKHLQIYKRVLEARPKSG